MRDKTAALKRICLAMVAGILALQLTANGQSGTPPVSDPMTALTAEIHALRVAIEQQTAIAPRIQLLMARLNIQEQRVSQLIQQLDQVRRQLGDTTLEAQKLAVELEEHEARVRTEPDNDTRKALTFEMQDIKRRQQATAALAEQLRARESEIARAL